MIEEALREAITNTARAHSTHDLEGKSDGIADCELRYSLEANFSHGQKVELRLLKFFSDSVLPRKEQKARLCQT